MEQSSSKNQKEEKGMENTRKDEAWAHLEKAQEVVIEAREYWEATQVELKEAEETVEKAQKAVRLVAKSGNEAWVAWAAAEGRVKEAAKILLVEATKEADENVKEVK